MEGKRERQEGETRKRAISERKRESKNEGKTGRLKSQSEIDSREQNELKSQQEDR